MKKLDLLEGPVRKTLLRFSIPTILGMAATQLYSVADTMIIGRSMDKYALGAVSNVDYCNKTRQLREAYLVH